MIMNRELKLKAKIEVVLWNLSTLSNEAEIIDKKHPAKYALNRAWNEAQSALSKCSERGGEGKIL